MRFDAFISYSHSSDGRLAPALQTGLQRLAKPWRRRRALEVFRDETGLTVGPDLWADIARALESADWFVVLASPESAGSSWVDQEVRHWMGRGPDAAERILLVRTGGTVAWDADTETFSSDTDAVSATLARAFAAEPRFIDLAWARDDADLGLENPRFRQAVAEIAAPIHGVTQDQLVGEDVRLHRRAVRVRRIAVATLVVLTVGAVAASVLAVRNASEADAQRQEAEVQRQEAEVQRNEAEAQRAEAESQRSTAEQRRVEAEEAAIRSRSNEFLARSATAYESNPELATLYAVEALYPDRSSSTLAAAGARDAVGVAARAVARSPVQRLPGHTPNFTAIGFDAASPTSALAGGDTVHIYRRDDPSLFEPGISRHLAGDRTFEIPDLQHLRITSDGRVVIALSGGPGGWIASGYDVESGGALWTYPVVSLLDVSSTGTVALDADTPTGPAVLVVDALSGAEEHRLQLRPPGTDFTRHVSAARFSPDGSRLAIAQHPDWTGISTPTRPLDGRVVLRIHTLDGRVGAETLIPLDGVGEVMGLAWFGGGADGSDAPSIPLVAAVDRFGAVHSFRAADGSDTSSAVSGYEVRTLDTSFPYPSTLMVAPDGRTVALITTAGEVRVGTTWDELRYGPSGDVRFRDLLEIGWWSDDTVLVYDEFLGNAVRYRIGQPGADHFPAPPEQSIVESLELSFSRSTLPSPDGRWIARVGTGAPTALEIEHRSDGESRVVEGEFTALTWHQDGRLVIGRSDGSISLVTPESGETRVLSGPRGHRVEHLAVSADGRRLYATSEANELQNEHGWLLTLDGELLDEGPVAYSGPTVSAADGSGFWVFESFVERWYFVPDDDPALACALAFEAAGGEFELEVGEPSVCAIVAELRQ